jgi:hypothetical protein
MSNPSAGMVRYNGNINNFEAYDGSTWMTLSGSIASIGMNANAESAIDWAMKKMAEEKEFELLAGNHPAIKIALENLNKAQEQLKATVLLSKEYDETTN